MILKRLTNLIAALLLVGMTPATVLADDPNGPDCAIPLSSLNTSGVNSPTGADSSTYSYNCNTGKWENDYYTWDPVTHITTPKYSQAYIYNQTSGKWESTTWYWSPAQNKWIASVSSLTYDPYAPPPPANNTNSISNTGADSTNGINSNSNNNANLSDTSNSLLNNSLAQGAATGDILVNANTTAGNATSGNALNSTDVLNMLQSSLGLQAGSDVKTFTANIQGDVNGDLMINPGALNSQTSTPNCGCTPNTNLTVNAKDSGSIDNNINSTANSGNVNVTDNTTAGNATSGTAAAIANVVNLLNSMISAGQSFIGVVNINGNMNGNVYIPNNLVDQLLASNVPSQTLNIGNSSLNENLSNTQAINNNLTTAANSGNVTQSDNTNAGNATSGNASNSVRVFNLTGRQIIDSNTLLVFINVSGQWVGFLMDASQAGVTAAALGGGVTQNCTSCAAGNSNTNVNADSTGSINNNINLAAKSGNVNTSGNTTVGNATSGNAKTALNLMNINNSGLSSSGWFGILFINILGNWHGNFCVNTSTPGCEIAGGSGGSSTTTSAGPQIFRFVPSSISNTGANSKNFILNKTGTGGGTITNTGSNSNNFIIAAGTSGPKQNTPSAGSSKWTIPLVSTVIGIALLGSEQIGAFVRKQNFGKHFKLGLGQVAHSLRILLF